MGKAYGWWTFPKCTAGLHYGLVLRPLTLGMPPSWAFTLQVFWNAALVRPYPIQDRSSLFPIDFYYHITIILCAHLCSRKKTNK